MLYPAKPPRLVDSDLMRGHIKLVQFAEYETKYCVQVKLPGGEVINSPMCFDLVNWTTEQILNSKTVQDWLIKMTGASPKVVWSI